MAGVTADTNIYVSGLHFGGTPREFLNQARLSAFRLAVSNPLLDEVRRVLRIKFLWEQDRLDDAFARIARFTIVVHPTRTIDAVPADPDDNRILECAVEAKSEYIVTGDHHLLDLGNHDGIRIVRVAEFMKVFRLT